MGIITQNGKVVLVNNSPMTYEDTGDLSLETLPVTQNGVYTAPQGIAYNIVDVDISSNPVAEERAVNFRDYEGTVRYSYTASEFANLEELPPNPTHEGLTAQGWNWTLSDAKSYVNNYGSIDIGQHYITESGNTELDIYLEEGQGTLYLGLAVNGSVTIDWGDGSSTDTVTGTSLTTQIRTSHTYSTTNKFYTIIIQVNSGSFSFYSSANYPVIAKYIDVSRDVYNWLYSSLLRRVRLGSNVQIGNYGFYRNSYLESITIPATISAFPQYSFYTCYSLKFITLPAGMTALSSYTFYQCPLSGITLPLTINTLWLYSLYNTNINNAILTNSNITSIPTYLFRYCYNLRKVVLPNSITSLGDYAFSYCQSLESLTLPSSLTTIGTYVFDHCYNLTNLTIPSTVTSIGGYAFCYCYKVSITFAPSSTLTTIGNYAFAYCYDMTSFTIPSTVTSIGNNAFYYCQSLTSIVVPSGVTSFGTNVFYYCDHLTSVTLQNSLTSLPTYTFYYCSALTSVTIPSTVTSIGTYCFRYSGLTSITIPAAVTSIGTYAFADCTSLQEIHFLGTTPPTIGSSYTFRNLPTTCKIYVPTGTLSTYTSTSYMPSSSTYTYIEE